MKERYKKRKVESHVWTPQPNWHKHKIDTIGKKQEGRNKDNHNWRKECIFVTKKSWLKTVKLESEKVNKLLKNIPTDYLTKLNNLIYARTKVFSDKLDKQIRNEKSRKKLKLDGKWDWRNKYKNLRWDEKVVRKTKHVKTESQQQ